MSGFIHVQDIPRPQPIRTNWQNFGGLSPAGENLKNLESWQSWWVSGRSVFQISSFSVSRPGRHPEILPRSVTVMSTMGHSASV